MFSAAEIYGCAPVEPSPVSTVGRETAYMSPSIVPSGVTGLLNPRNPLTWLAILALATVGAAGVAGSVRLGPARLSGAVGKA